MDVKTISRLLIFFGAIMIVMAMRMETTYEGYYNVGLISKQQNYLILGGLAFISGIVLFATWKAKQTPEPEPIEHAEYKTTTTKIKVATEAFLTRSIHCWRNWHEARSNLLGRFLVSAYVGALLSPNFYSMVVYTIVNKLSGINASLSEDFPTEVMFLVAIVFLYASRAVPAAKAIKQLLAFNVIIVVLYGLVNVLIFTSPSAVNVTGEIYTQLHSDLIFASIGLVILSSVLTLLSHLLDD